MTRFIELLESGRVESCGFDGPEVRRALEVLWWRCKEQGELKTERAWRLCRQEALALEQETGFCPRGGWRGLAGLAIGTGMMRAQEGAFLARHGELEDWIGSSPEERVLLLEGFTRWLIPPGVAAGLFLAMGVHPAWGIRLAHHLHCDGPIIETPAEGFRDSTVMPEEDLSELRKGIFAALSVIFSGLRKLEPGWCYSQEALSGFIGEAIRFGRAQIEESGLGLKVVIDDLEGSGGAQARSVDFAYRELMEGVMVPAGVMRRFDDETFAVDSTVLEGLRVGHLGRDAQRTWFQDYLADSSAVLVA